MLRITERAYRVSSLENLRVCYSGVCHVRVHTAAPVPRGPGASPAGDGLVIPCKDNMHIGLVMGAMSEHEHTLPDAGAGQNLCAASDAVAAVIRQSPTGELSHALAHKDNLGNTTRTDRLVAECQVVHAALRRRARPKGLQQDVDRALRRQHVPAHHRSLCGEVTERPGTVSE